MSRAIKVRLYSKPAKKYIDYITVGFLNTGELRSYSTENGFGPVLEDNYIVEQYTGIKDKNGKEIFAGDIVEIDKYGKFQVIWNEWACKFDFDKIGKREREEPLLSQDWEEKTEVIGNIHKNKKLLGGEK